MNACVTVPTHSPRYVQNFIKRSTHGRTLLLNIFKLSVSDSHVVHFPEPNNKRLEVEDKQAQSVFPLLIPRHTEL